MANEKVLERSSVTPDEIRELMSFAEAYGPLADEYEAMGQFLPKGAPALFGVRRQRLRFPIHTNAKAEALPPHSTLRRAERVSS
jgi:hypothetical protein